MTSTDSQIGGWTSAQSSVVTVDGKGSGWIDSGSIHIGTDTAGQPFGPAELDISNGGYVSSASAFVGTVFNSLASIVNVDGAGSAWDITGPLAVGLVNNNRGSGELDITGGGHVTAGSAQISDYQGSAEYGMIRVDGPGSLLAIGGALTFGHSVLGLQTGVLVVSGGAQVNDASAASVGPSSLNGTVIVTGPGSAWSTSGDINFNGILTVSDGGKVEVGGLFKLQGRGTALGKLQGNGTVIGDVESSGAVAPGLSPGILTINGNYTQDPTGALQIELGGLNPGAEFDQLVVSGNVTLSGTLSVSLLNGFMPSIGNSFDILDWGSLSGTFATLQLPSLGDSMGWDTSQLYTTGTITAVPEPATLMLTMIATPIAAASASRRRGLGRPMAARRARRNEDSGPPNPHPDSPDTPV